MRKRRLPPSRNQSPQRRRNLRRFLAKRHLHLKHRHREVQRMLEIQEAMNCEEEPTTP